MYFFPKGLHEQRFLRRLAGMTYMSGVLWQDFLELLWLCMSVIKFGWCDSHHSTLKATIAMSIND